MIAATIANMGHGGDRKRDEINGSIEPLKSNAEAAAMMNVGVNTVKRAKKVINNAVPVLQSMVTGGDVSVSAAAAVATLPEVDLWPAPATPEAPTAPASTAAAGGTGHPALSIRRSTTPTTSPRGDSGTGAPMGSRWRQTRRPCSAILTITVRMH